MIYSVRLKPLMLQHPSERTITELVWTGPLLSPPVHLCAAESRKRQREQESCSRALEEPPERRLCENAAVLSDRSPSPQPSTCATQPSTCATQPSTCATQPSTCAPQARLKCVQLEVSTPNVYTVAFPASCFSIGQNHSGHPWAVTMHS